MSAENPGSFNEWSERHSGNTGGASYGEYSEALTEYRQSLAEQMGMTEKEFHESFRTHTTIHAGEIAVEHEAQLIRAS